MKKFAAVLMVSVLGNATVFGGAVSFAPSAPPSAVTVLPSGVVEWDRSVAPPGLLMFDVNVDPAIEGMDAMDMIIGSTTVPLSAFAYSGEFTTGVSQTFVPQFNLFGYYPNEVYLAGTTPPPPALPFDTDRFVLGRLTSDLTGLPDGQYEIVVDPITDQMLSQVARRGVFDPLEGTAMISIVPEPASLSLLAIGALAAIRFGCRRTHHSAARGNKQN